MKVCAVPMVMSAAEEVLGTSLKNSAPSRTPVLLGTLDSTAGNLARQVEICSHPCRIGIHAYNTHTGVGNCGGRNREG